MARRKMGDSKTDAIVNYSKEHPQEGPSAIADALNAQGLKVTAQYVSTIKSKFGLSGPRKGKRKAAKKGKSAAAKPRRAASRGGSGVSYDNLVQAQEFVRSQGGLDRARRVLDAYASLQ